MSIEQSNKIDFISINPNEKVQLTISDHLEWDNVENHILILQDKVNAYLNFIESGQIPKQYNQAKQNGIIISLSTEFYPSENSIKYLDKFKNIIQESGYEFEWKQI